MTTVNETLATPRQRRELERLCRVGNRRERFDRLQVAAIISGVILAAYTPALSVVLALVHVR